ncbi:ATP-binding cassette domain-containing protein [Lacticaseibacillus jixianensis]|uniref:ATP-binding cassette domain-containing protein n=1 Tax=Lacticaseibacillus jixianensis TaxID=2486012 RepID=A0ABW4B6S4_9LACO|nr:ATP-binding cassette domain-containing protein [Lacticaseibacillus jixianensis]
MNNDDVIQVSNISKHFGKNAAVQDVSFSVEKGEIFGLLGPNGAGKTTLIRMMTTLLHPDTGQILINGFDTQTQGRNARQQFSVTGQTAAIDQDLTARENLMIFARLSGLGIPAARSRATELLKAFDLVASADQTLETFSGGMRRRLDLAVSLVGKPTILFLDEPTTGLDPRTRAQMWQVIQSLVATGSTVLLTTQYLEEAAQFADRIALIDHGQMKAIGTPDELTRRVGGKRLRLQVTAAQSLKAAQVILQKTEMNPVQVSERTLTVSLDEGEVGQTAALLQQFDEAGIALSQFAIEPPSLDDVFLQMTVGKN